MDVARVAWALLGVASIAAAGVVAWRGFQRWQASRRPLELTATDALARFVLAPVTDPVLFGGGAAAAQSRRRRETVAYGYLAAVEEFVPAGGGAPWCTLTVTLPGRGPALCVDRTGARDAVGYGPAVRFDDLPWTARGDAALLTPSARAVLGRLPVQRVALHDGELLLRSPDGVHLSELRVAELVRAAEEFLAAAPSVLTHDRAGRPLLRLAGADAPLAPGWHALAEAEPVAQRAGRRRG